MSLLQVKNLKVNFGGIEALKGISFSVEQGQIVTLIGANGAGKSTTLRAISWYTLRGQHLHEAGHYPWIPKRSWNGIAMVPEGRRVFSNRR